MKLATVFHLYKILKILNTILTFSRYFTVCYLLWGNWFWHKVEKVFYFKNSLRRLIGKVLLFKSLESSVPSIKIHTKMTLKLWEDFIFFKSNRLSSIWCLILFQWTCESSSHVKEIVVLTVALKSNLMMTDWPQKRPTELTRHCICVKGGEMWVFRSLRGPESD